MVARLGFLALSLSLVSCNKDKDTGEAEDHGRPTISITSPADGATFTEGDEVALTVTAEYEDGTPAEITDATWTAGSWSVQGPHTSATDLPAGTLALEVEATVDDKPLTASVNITVEAASSGEGEGEGEGEGDIPYRGPFLANLTLSGYTAACNGSVDFVLSPANAMAGTGTCVIEDLDESVTFELTGDVTGSTVAGALVLYDDTGTPYATPFDGTTTGTGHMSCTFDETFTSSDGSLRIDGNFQADPI